jgi:hypothetical protein
MREALQRGGQRPHIYGRLWDNALCLGAGRDKRGGLMLAGVLSEVTSEDLIRFDAHEGTAPN